MKQSNNKGASVLIAIVIVVFIVVLLGFFAYIILRNGKINSEYSSATTQPVTSSQELETAGVSDSDEVGVIEKELDLTSEGSFDSDFEDLDQEASSL